MACRRQAEYNSGKHRNGAGKKEDSPIGVDVELDGKLKRRMPVAEAARKKDRKPVPGGSAGERQDERFRQHLPHDSPAAGAEGESNGNLALPVGGAGSEKAGEIRTRREQNQARKHHHSDGKCTCRTADEVANQPRARYSELQSLVVVRLLA